MTNDLFVTIGKMKLVLGERVYLQMVMILVDEFNLHHHREIIGHPTYLTIIKLPSV